MNEKIIKTAKDLIKIRSISKNPEGLNDAVDLSLSLLKGFRIEVFEFNHVKSILVFNRDKRPEKFRLILNGHLDVVPGKDSNYKPTIQGNKLYGVGALDMKASTSCLIHVFKDLAHKVKIPIALQLTTDEEIGGFCGTKHQIENGIKGDFIITGEPTNLGIVNQAKGVLNIELSAKGKTAHGAYPWRGENAIWKMNDLLNSINKMFPTLEKEKWVTTVNLSRIRTTNESFNKIPDDCTISLDVRFIQGERDKTIEIISSLLDPDIQMKIIVDEPAMFVDGKDRNISALQQVAKDVTGKIHRCYGANGTSDVRHYSRINTPGIEFGPIGENIGADSEWVDIRSLEQYYQILKRFILKLDSEK